MIRNTFLRAPPRFTVVCIFYVALFCLCAAVYAAEGSGLLCQTANTQSPKSHLERYQLLYGAFLGLFSASLIYVGQQTFNKWWASRNGWEKVHAIVSAQLRLLRDRAESGDLSTNTLVDLAWVIRYASDSGVPALKLGYLLEALAAIDGNFRHSKSVNIADIYQLFVELEKKWNERLAR